MDRFLPFYPPNNLKNQNFEKPKKPRGDIITLHMCSINDNHMIYGSWDIEHGEQNFFVILDYFLFFYPLTTWKIEILENWKKTSGDVIILHKRTKNHDHMVCCSLDMTHRRCNCYFSFWAIFCPFTSNSPKNQNLKKVKKTPGDIIILQKCTKNHDHMLCCSGDMVCDGSNYFSFWAIFCPFTP